MAKLQVGRIATVANTANVIDFEVKGYEFLVTNLTDSNIYVTLGSKYNANNNVIVPPETSRVVTAKMQRKREKREGERDRGKKERRKDGRKEMREGGVRALGLRISFWETTCSSPKWLYYFMFSPTKYE